MSVVYYDLETTGLNPPHHRGIEIISIGNVMFQLFLKLMLIFHTRRHIEICVYITETKIIQSLSLQAQYLQDQEMAFKCS